MQGVQQSVSLAFGYPGIQELVILAVLFLIGVLPAVIAVRVILSVVTNDLRHINSIPFARFFPNLLVPYIFLWQTLSDRR